MKSYKTILINLISLLILIPGMASAYDGNWKRGDVYYRMVCTDCHKNQPVGKVPPDSRTQAGWTAYLVRKPPVVQPPARAAPMPIRLPPRAAQTYSSGGGRFIAN